MKKELLDLKFKYHLKEHLKEMVKNNIVIVFSVCNFTNDSGDLLFNNYLMVTQDSITNVYDNYDSLEIKNFYNNIVLKKIELNI